MGYNACMKRKSETRAWDRGAIHLQPDLTLMVLHQDRAVQARLSERQALNLAHALIRAVGQVQAA